ncbi:MAG: ATP-binding cassette domain-containing protein, partial [Acidobacteriota bacterium]|nr:ATP-binding cassette domain-containing protein [Acidobacteriota bacterium]
DDLGIVAPRATNTELRTILGSFLFSEDDVFKRIGVLSGGERNRYALARMLMMPSNFLLLDEPTNHLDMRAKDVLLEALQKFTGTVVFVSHDRYFLDQLATRVFEIGGGEVRIYPGNYEDYLWRKSGGPEVAAESAKPEPKPEPAPVAVSAPAAVAEKRVNPMQLRKITDRHRAIEEKIGKLEDEIADYERELSNFTSVEQTVKLNDIVTARRGDLEKLLAEWEEVAELIEANT